MTLAHQYGPVGGWKPAAPSRMEMFNPDSWIRLEAAGMSPWMFLTFFWVSGFHIPNTSPRDRGVLLACWEDFVIFSGSDCVVVVEIVRLGVCRVER